ncbi:hypothetical protein HDU98_010815, partial [Podochytrium sp. JEL0797]
MGNLNAASATGKGPASASDLSQSTNTPSTLASPPGVGVPDRESATPSATPTATGAVPAKSRTTNAGSTGSFTPPIAVGSSSASGSRTTSHGQGRPVAQTHQSAAGSSSRSGIHTHTSSQGRSIANAPAAAVSIPISPEKFYGPSAAAGLRAAVSHQVHEIPMSYALCESIVINGLEAFTVLRAGLPRLAAAFEAGDCVESLQLENSRLSEECAMLQGRVVGLESNLDAMTQACSALQVRVAGMESNLTNMTEACVALQGRVVGLESNLVEMTRARTALHKSWSDAANKAVENGRLSCAYKGVIDLMMNRFPEDDRFALLKHLELAERGSGTNQQPLHQPSAPPSSNSESQQPRQPSPLTSPQNVLQPRNSAEKRSEPTGGVTSESQHKSSGSSSHPTFDSNCHSQSNSKNPKNHSTSEKGDDFDELVSGVDFSRPVEPLAEQIQAHPRSAARDSSSSSGKKRQRSRDNHDSENPRHRIPTMDSASGDRFSNEAQRKSSGSSSHPAFDSNPHSQFDSEFDQGDKANTRRKGIDARPAMPRAAQHQVSRYASSSRASNSVGGKKRQPYVDPVETPIQRASMSALPVDDIDAE